MGERLLFPEHYLFNLNSVYIVLDKRVNKDIKGYYFKSTNTFQLITEGIKDFKSNDTNGNKMKPQSNKADDRISESPNMLS
jgi:hypothetical protein